MVCFDALFYDGARLRNLEVGALRFLHLNDAIADAYFNLH